jgi:hypothetical protein
MLWKSGIAIEPFPSHQINRNEPAMGSTELAEHSMDRDRFLLLAERRNRT